MMQKCRRRPPSSGVFSSSFVEHLDDVGLRVTEIKYCAATSCSSSVTPPFANSAKSPPGAKHKRPEWQIAAEMVLAAVEGSGPLMFAEIAIRKRVEEMSGR